MSISRLISVSSSFGHLCRRSSMYWQIATCAVVLLALPSSLPAANTIVRMEINFGNTPAGNIDIELYDDEAPKNVQNFLRYAGYFYHLRCASLFLFSCTSYSYYARNPIIIHRDAGFAIQGGGYYYLESVTDNYDAVPGPSVQDEYSLSRPNLAGTIAMALKAPPGGEPIPHSATGQWFINLVDNPTGLSKYTVFGEVRSPGMDIVKKIADLDAVNLNDSSDDQNYTFPAFGELPVLSNYDSVTTPKLKPLPENLVLVAHIPNVAGTDTGLGTIPTYTADVDMVFDSIATASVDDAKEKLKSFSSPPNESIYFNNGIQTFSVSGPIGPGQIIKIKLYDGATTRPTRYYAYGKTPDNPTDHWYDFSYDSATGTGAKIEGDKILLHFVDGQRGDEDLTANDSITHTGGQAVVTTTTTSSDSGASGGGCSIAARTSAPRSGDWLLVSLFLAFVALARRRARRNQV